MPEIIDNSDSSATATAYSFYDEPLYLSSTDQPSLKLADFNFNGTNFQRWKRETYLALISKNKEGFIDGSFKKPENSDKKYHQWIRCDLLVMRWMKNTMEPEIKETFEYVTSSRELWTELIERYGEVNAIEIYQLRKELNGISQVNHSLIEYYSSMKRTWETIDNLDPIPTCSCGALNSCSCQLLKRILDRDSQAKLIQFLMGLNSGYEQVKTNILSMEPLPPLNKAMSLLQKVERQKQVSDAVDVLAEATAYVAQSEASTQVAKKAKISEDGAAASNATVKKCTHCTKEGHTIENCYRLQTCEYCGKKGHVKAICRWNPNRGSRGRGRGASRGGAPRRMANHAESQFADEYDTPFEGFYNADRNNPSSNSAQSTFNSNLVDGLVESVMQKVLRSLDNSSNTGSEMASANFAGPFK